MNENEDEIRRYLEYWNLTVVHGGSPDFLCFRGNPKNETASCVFFVEVKSDRSPVITDKQFLWITVLKQCNLDCFIINPNNPDSKRLFMKQIGRYAIK